MAKLARHVTAVASLSACLLAATPCHSPAPKMPDTVLTDRWTDVKCSFENGHISYSSGQKSARIKLDAKLANPKQLLCSENYSVVLGDDEAVVALGAYAVLEEDRRMMRRPFAPANSYVVEELKDPSSNYVVSASVSGNTFSIKTDSGRTWTMSLSNPTNWE